LVFEVFGIFLGVGDGLFEVFVDFCVEELELLTGVLGLFVECILYLFLGFEVVSCLLVDL
jgi:hypothetical protein